MAFERSAEQRRIAAEANVGVARFGDDLELAKWRAHKEAVKKYMRDGIVPHNAIVLTNILCVATLLLVSCATDVALFMSRRDVPILRSISTGTLVAVAVPLVATMESYFLRLRHELQTQAKQYQPK